MPPEVIGRTGLLDDFDQALGRSSGAHRRRTIITGARGIGKTVMLGVAQDLARGHGWAVISETATVGLAGRLGVSVRRLAEERFSVSVGRAWQDVSANLLRRLREAGSGLFITVDEFHAVGQEDLVQVGTAVGSFARKDFPSPWWLQDCQLRSPGSWATERQHSCGKPTGSYSATWQWPTLKDPWERRLPPAGLTLRRALSARLLRPPTVIPSWSSWSDTSCGAKPRTVKG
jgi:hypothetical protein